MDLLPIDKLTLLLQYVEVLKERLTAIMKSKKHTKLAILLSMCLVIAMVLVACGLWASSGSNDTPNDETDSTENQPISAANLNIDRKSDELLNTFNASHNFDFLEVFDEYHDLEDDHHFFSIDDDWGIVIWADATLRDIQVIIIDYDITEYEDVPFVAAYFPVTEELSLRTPLVLNRFVTIGGVIPREGISFIDPTGVRRYFAISDNRIDDTPPLFLTEFEIEGSG